MAPAKPKTVKVTYNGGLAGVDVMFPSRRQIQAQRGKPIEVNLDDAETLRANPEWDTTKLPPKPKPEPEPDEPATEQGD